jgi:hypothetical protein
LRLGKSALITVSLYLKCADQSINPAILGVDPC